MEGTFRALAYYEIESSSIITLRANERFIVGYLCARPTYFYCGPTRFINSQIGIAVRPPITPPI